MTARVVTTIDVSGPFFSRDPTITYDENVRVMLEAVAKEGEQDVKAQMDAGEGGREPFHGGRVSQYVTGRVQALSGKTWFRNVVISPDRTGLSAEDAIGLYAAASKIEGETHPFRRTATRLRSSRAVQVAELTKGLG